MTRCDVVSQVVTETVPESCPSVVRARPAPRTAGALVAVSDHRLTFRYGWGPEEEGRASVVAAGRGSTKWIPTWAVCSWANLLRDAERRGMRAPVLAVGDGALGFWKALRDIFPDTREQRCWVHKTANVVDALPKSAQPAAKTAIAQIYNAEDKEHAGKAVRAFERQYGAKFPKAVEKITKDEEELLTFYDYPAEHWIHLRTTNPIESTFATVRLRTRVTRGAGSRTAALAMTFKLIESAQMRWRAVNAPHLVALVRAGARFERGVLLEREAVA
jgi:putative transposase